MDWIRYADTHGSEGDPAIPHASQYRDYLIRALNADVPYDQLLLEHFAGDLLDKPRLNGEKQLNESAIGPGHLRMVFHGFSPTDALDERVRFTDDQINTITKAFLGLTVSCARCHDHKFDAISQADYYALFGIFSSTLPATIAIDAPGVLERHRTELEAMKPDIRKRLAAFWMESLPGGAKDWEIRVNGKGEKGSALALLAETLKSNDPAAVTRLWSDSEKRSRNQRDTTEKMKSGGDLRYRWNLSDPVNFKTWSRYGEGLADAAPAAAGEFTLTDAESDPDRVVGHILPSGAYSHLLSTRHRAVLASAPFDLDGGYDLHLLVSGEGSSVRYAVQHYPRSGTVFPVTNLDQGDWRWVKYDRIDYWDGDSIHLELATGPDAPLLVEERDRSWFGIREAVLVKKGSPGPAGLKEESLAALFSQANQPAPQTSAQAFTRYAETMGRILSAWGQGSPSLDDASALFLNEVLTAGLLPNALSQLPADLQEMVRRYRTLEADIPLPTRAPGVFERAGINQALFVRGDHKQPGPPVPRRFLEAIDAAPYKTAGTGRLEFARDLIDPKNPFTTRVIVNRIWHHLFGEGIVPTVDNFGRLGEKPSHPELLDFLADRFRNGEHWSLKTLIRDLVLTETWQQASGESDEAMEKDPANRLLSSFPLRRLEAEAIRDAFLAVSGQLNRERYGPGVGGGDPRRSIYLRVKRNDLDPLLTTFDFPVPASAVGRRDITNVPAQSLTLLNDPFLIAQAKQWAAAMKATLPSDADEDRRIRLLFERALTRSPTDHEMAGAKSFLAALDGEHRADAVRFTEISATLKKTRESRDTIIEPLRLKMQSERSLAFTREKGEPVPKAALDPIAHWDFEKGTTDLIGGLALTLEGSAKLEKGALLLDGNGFAASLPLPFDLAEKTLEATVELASLDQAGGGVMTVQDLNGGDFDSIVFAERQAKQWLAGSNGFQRTLDFEAPDDTMAATEPVHLVLTYEKDGTIRCFRNGVSWGEPIRKADLHSFQRGKSMVLFGLRHGTAVSGNRALRGRLLEARLYDRALSESEVHAAFSGGPLPVTRKDIDAVLSDDSRIEVKKLEAAIALLEAEQKELRQLGSDAPLEERRWQDLALAIFNLKEFIYLR